VVAEDLPKVSLFMRRLMLPVIFALGAAMLVVVFAQVVFRYVLAHPLPWSEELARYLMIWVACLAASEAYAKGSHIGIMLIVNAIRPGLRKVMILIIHLAVCVLMGVIVYQGFALSFMVGDERSPAMELPMTWPYVAVPVGAGLIFIQAVALFFKQMAEPSPGGDVCNLEQA
jgi:TRAP-type C4-dicarboxylate transport system permease small subunit